MSAVKGFTIPPVTIEAQRRASDPAVSSWASANAGAGKTHVLTSRVARLLLAGTPPAKILCVTFTKAAAAQMMNRLFAMLGKWSTMSDEALRGELAKIGADAQTPEDFGAARRLFARALETPGGLKIQTIHAFAQGVLARFPLEAGIAPGFEVMDDTQARVLVREARDSLLDPAAHARDPALGDAIALITQTIEETGFDALLKELLGRRLDLEPALGTADHRAALWGQILARLQVAETDTQAQTLAEALAPPAFPDAAMRRAKDALLGGSKNDQKLGASFAEFFAADDRGDAFPIYRRIFLTLKDKPKAPQLLATQATQKAFVGLLDDLLAEQERVMRLDARLKALRCAAMTKALITLAAHFFAGYGAAKRQRGVLDYDDLIGRTRALLAQDGASAWVHFKLDQGIDHILVDEAQDTSPASWDIVRTLADEFFVGEGARPDAPGPRTVFAVGDEKQSIYSFQGAEPAGFARTKSYFSSAADRARLTWDPIALTLSFRSAPQILQAVDLVFADAQSAEMVSVGGGAVHHEPLRAGAPGLVEVWPVLSPDEEPAADVWTAPLDRPARLSPPARLAAHLARTIEGWLGKGTILASTQKPMTPGDILVLVRRRTVFVNLLVRELKQRAIPVAGIDRLALTDHIAVMDLMAAGRCALLPEDDLTLATVLRGPLFGWSEEALFALAHGRKASLWTALTTAGDTDEAARTAKTRLEDMRERARRGPVFEFYAWLLAEEGARAALLARLGPDAADPMEEFLTLAQSYDRQRVPDLTGFLDTLERNRLEIKRDLDAGDDQGPGEVRIMTVHGAKGLEAPVVILPDTCGAPDGKQDPKVLIETGTDDTAPNLFWPLNKQDDPEPARSVRDTLAEKREAEYRRLLYVAMTRAEDRLYVCGYEGKHRRPAACWYNLVQGALAPVAEPVIGPLGEGLRLGAPLADQGAPGLEPAPQELPARPQEPAAPAWLSVAAPLDTGPGARLTPSHVSDLVEGGSPLPALPPGQRLPNDRFQRGRLVHKLLQVLPDQPDEGRTTAGARFLAHPAHGLSEAEQADLLCEVIGVIENPDFAPLFGPDSTAEVPIAGQLPPPHHAIVVDGQIDRLAVLPDRVQIIDYKTNRPAPATLEGVSGAYLSQMALYRALLTQVFPGRPVECVLLWTAEARAMRLPDRLLDQALADITARRANRGPRPASDTPPPAPA